MANSIRDKTLPAKETINVRIRKRAIMYSFSSFDLELNRLNLPAYLFFIFLNFSYRLSFVKKLLTNLLSGFRLIFIGL